MRNLFKATKQILCDHRSHTITYNDGARLASICIKCRKVTDIQIRDGRDISFRKKSK